MNISMFILYDELFNYERIPIITDGGMNIKGLRVFSDNSAISPDYVYLGYTHDFFNFENDGVLLANGYDFIIIEHAELLDVMNTVLSVIDKYNDFSRQFEDAANTPSPYQKILDIAHEIFHCPMFFGHKNLRIYAITQQYTDEDVYEGWSEVKRLMTMPLDLIRKEVAPDMTKYPDDIDPVAIPTCHGDLKKFNYQIRSNVYMDGKIWGHFYCYFNRNMITPAIMQLAKYVAGVFSGVLAQSSVPEQYKNADYSFLIDFLNGSVIEKDVLSNLQGNQFGSSDGVKLQMMVINPKPDNRILFDYYYSNLIHQSHDEIIFPYRDSIVVILPFTKETTPLKIQLNVIMDMNFSDCGISYPFSELNDIRDAYYQALYAISKPAIGHSSYHYYKDVAFSGIIDYSKSKINWRNFVEPELFSLINYDKQNGTEYYKTLFCMLLNNYHSANTAKLLFIHRNTLKYRLDKIREITGLDYYDPDVADFLRYCYALMLSDYPLNLPLQPSSDSELDGAGLDGI